MKRKLFAVAISAIVLLSGCSGSQDYQSSEWKYVKEQSGLSLSTDEEMWNKLRSHYNQYSDMSDGDFWNRVFLEVVYPETKVDELNLTAYAIQCNTSTIITMLDARLNGMKPETDYVQVFDIKVDNGTWSCNAANPDYFENNSLTWGSNGSANASMQENDIKNGESYLCYQLCLTMSSIKNASIKIALCRGRCRSVIYVDDSNTTITYGDNCPNVDSKGDLEATYSWNGKIAGVAADGTILGTSPVVALN